jgi:hypothetical protein
MVRTVICFGLLAISLQWAYASGRTHQFLVHLRGSDFHRYPPRMFFTSEGRLVIAYRVPNSKEESSLLRVVVVDGQSGDQILTRSYPVLSAGPRKIADYFAESCSGQSIVYVELTGSPVALEINSSTFDVKTETKSRTFNMGNIAPCRQAGRDSSLKGREAQIRVKNGLDAVEALDDGGFLGRSNRSVAGSLQLFDDEGSIEKTLKGSGCGFVSLALSPDQKYGVAVCDRTGTTEWTFGKTLGREAVVFNTASLAQVANMPLSKQSLQTSMATDEWRVWYPQPAIWDSKQCVVIAAPDFSGTIRFMELAPPEGGTSTTS